MAVFTQISKQQLSEAIEPYGLQDLQSYMGFSAGVENTTYGLMCSDSTFVLTMFERRVEAEDIPFFVNLLNEFRVGGIDCPEIIKSKSGETSFRIDGKLCILQSFIEGAVVELPSPNQCKLAGSQLGKMHLIAKESTLKKENVLGLNQWQSLIPIATNHTAPIWQARAAQIRGLYSNIRKSWPQSLPSGPVHADYFTDNVFFRPDGQPAVIDFFLASTDLFTYDLAIALVSWAFDDAGDISIDHMMSFLKGYQATYTMSEAEKDALPLLCKAAALRILLTRLIDDQIERKSVQLSDKAPEPFWRRLIAIDEAEKANQFEIFINN